MMAWKNITLIFWNVNVNTKSSNIDIDRSLFFSRNTQIRQELNLHLQASILTNEPKKKISKVLIFVIFTKIRNSTFSKVYACKIS